MADGGGSDWEVVSLTASAYAAAPGPIPIPVSPTLHDAHKTESPILLLPNRPAPNSHFFMSQHFNLPSEEPLFSTTTHLENNNAGQELESGPAVPDGDDADHLNTARPENRDGGRDDLQVEGGGGGGGGGGDEVQQTTTAICSLPDATAAAGSDDTAVGSATLPAPAATLPVAAPSGGVSACSCNAAQAWWEKTFSFPRQDGSGNGTQPLAFRFVFVAGKLQIQENHLSPVPGFGQTQKISCAVTEPLDQAKVSMLDGGSPVAQQG